MKTNRIYSLLCLIGVIMVLAWPAPSAAESGRLFSMWQPHKSTPGELLRSAAYEGNLSEIKRLLAQGADVDARDKEGWTPLIWAQAGNRPEAATLLLQRRADVDAKDNAGCTALHQAATAGRERVMAVLLAYGADVENTSGYGYTPLMDAAHYGKAVAVELLLAGGADPNAISMNGNTAVSLAEKRGHKNVAMLLVANGADPNLQGKKLQAALARNGSRSTGPARVRLAGHMRNLDVLDSLCHECLSQEADANLRLISGQRPDFNSRLAAWCQQRGMGDSRDARTFDQGSGNGRLVDRLPRTAGKDPGGASYLLREAIETWEQLQSKYPDADKRIRDLSRKGVSVEKLSSREPLLQKAMKIWTSLQSEHPDLAAQLLTIAGMGR